MYNIAENAENVLIFGCCLREGKWIVKLFDEMLKKCGAEVLVLRSVERGKCGAAAGRSALRNNFLSAVSAEQNQVLRGSIFSCF